MSREFTSGTDNAIKGLLSTLADKSTVSDKYKDSMYQLGLRHGQQLIESLKDKKVCLACTVEDADYLARGIAEAIGPSVSSLSIACFWNKRIVGDEFFANTAPVLKQYVEPGCNGADVIIVVKSIISGACVVKTNLTTLIQKANPQKIFVVAPVVRVGAEEKLSKEFPESVSNKFQYNYFAIDTDYEPDTGEVIPGIGGNVYQRLGFGNQEGKNKYTPDFVKSRRAEFASL
jgi:hypothetical protein